MNKNKKNKSPKGRYSQDNRPYRKSSHDDIYEDGFSNKSNYVDLYSSGRRKKSKISVKK